jgi:hypothetical protein
LDSGWTFNPHPLRTIDYVLQDLWAWVAESKVPDFGECTARSPLCVAIEAISSDKEGGLRDIFRKIFENKLVVTILEKSKNGMIGTP